MSALLSPVLFINDVAGVALTVFVLGVRHGFDPDHLAAIDGMTRFNALTRRSLARNVGVLFSLGHGGVVVLTALMVSVLVQSWQVPQWIAATGAWLSIAVLVVLAGLNIVSVLHTPAAHAVAMTGWRSRLLQRFLSAGTAVAICGVGALFAVSYDTLSLAALFGVTAARAGSWGMSLELAGLFVAGMMVTDGLNGLWIARLMQGSQRCAAIASRTLALAIAGVALLTAASGIAAQVAPVWAAAWAAPGWVSLAMIGILTASFIGGRYFSRLPAGAAS